MRDGNRFIAGITNCLLNGFGDVEILDTFDFKVEGKLTDDVGSIGVTGKLTTTACLVAALAAFIAPFPLANATLGTAIHGPGRTCRSPAIFQCQFRKCGSSHRLWSGEGGGVLPQDIGGWSGD